MKKLILLAAIVGFFFLNVSSKEYKKEERQEQAQPDQTMPQIPNGDFEDWQHLVGREYELKIWKTNSYPLSMGQMNRYIVIPDSIIVYHGKYSAKLIDGAYAKNQFPISVHPSSLHGYVKGY